MSGGNQRVFKFQSGLNLYYWIFGLVHSLVQLSLNVWFWREDTLGRWVRVLVSTFSSGYREYVHLLLGSLFSVP